MKTAADISNGERRRETGQGGGELLKYFVNIRKTASRQARARVLLLDAQKY